MRCTSINFLPRHHSCCWVAWQNIEKADGTEEIGRLTKTTENFLNIGNVSEKRLVAGKFLSRNVFQGLPFEEY